MTNVDTIIAIRPTLLYAVRPRTDNPSSAEFATTVASKAIVRVSAAVPVIQKTRSAGLRSLRTPARPSRERTLSRSHSSREPPINIYNSSYISKLSPLTETNNSAQPTHAT